MRMKKQICLFVVFLTVLCLTSCAFIGDSVGNIGTDGTVQPEGVGGQESSAALSEESTALGPGNTADGADSGIHPETENIHTDIIFGIDGETLAVDQNFLGGLDFYYTVYQRYNATEKEKAEFLEWQNDSFSGKMEKMLRNGCFNVPDEDMKYIDFRSFDSWIINDRGIKKKIGYTTAATYPGNINLWNSHFPVQKIIMHSENLISLVYKLKSFDQTFYAYVMLEKSEHNLYDGVRESWNYNGEIYYAATLSFSEELMNVWEHGYKFTEDDYRNYPLLLACRTLGTENKNEEWMEYVVCKDGILVLIMRCDYDVKKGVYENLHHCEVISTAFYKYGESRNLEFGYSTFIERGITPSFVR